MTSEKPLRADARRNREAILSAAREVFESDEPIRFDDFASRAGVGVGTLYRHFPTREALAAGVYQGEVAALCARACQPERTPAENLVAFLRGFVSYIVDHAALARTLSGLVSPGEQAEGGSELERTVANLVAQGVRDGDLRPDVKSGALMVVLHGIGSAHARPEWAEESHHAIELLILGLQA